MALSVLFGVLAVLLASGYLRQHGGWDLESGSNDLMTIMLLVLGFVLALSVVVLRPGAGNANGTRLTSVFWTVALLVALLFTWRVIVVLHRWERPSGRWSPLPRSSTRSSPRIRTRSTAMTIACRPGSFCNRSSFSMPTTSSWPAIVWQTYGPEIPDHVMRGIVLPEAVEEAYKAEEVWRVERDDGTEQIGWYFSGKFRQNFDYRLYPFDRQDIWLRIWSPEPVEGVLLGARFRCLPRPDAEHACRESIPSSCTVGGTR